jgi:hypothetical protein
MAAKKSAPTKRKAPEKPQRERFKEFAREHGADDPDAVDRALGSIGRAARDKPLDDAE